MRSTTTFVLMVAATCRAGDAEAQSSVGTGRIGSAVDIRGTVESNVQGRTYPLNRGGTVYFEQYVNTRANSVAGLEMLDQSRVHVGPSSSLRLDKPQWNPATLRGAVSMRVKAGEYRVKTTAEDRATYKMHDPNGTLTVGPSK